MALKYKGTIIDQRFKEVLKAIEDVSARILSRFALACAKLRFRVIHV